MSKTLGIPTNCANSSSAFELLSIWLNEGEPTIQFRPDVFSDAAAWGLILADVARSVANKHASDTNQPLDQVMGRIIEGFRIELQSDDWVMD